MSIRPVAPRLAPLLAMSFGAVTWLAWPDEFAFTRKLAAMAVSCAWGFHTANAIQAQGRLNRVCRWLECLAFPLVILSFVWLPEMKGWLLLAGGWCWRFLVANLWRQPGAR